MLVNLLECLRMAELEEQMRDDKRMKATDTHRTQPDTQLSHLSVMDPRRVKSNERVLL